jgi:hypothetical protein
VNPHTSEFAAGVDQESDHGFVAPIDQGLALARIEQCGQLVVVEHRHRLIDRNREDARQLNRCLASSEGSCGSVAPWAAHPASSGCLTRKRCADLEKRWW